MKRLFLALIALLITAGSMAQETRQYCQGRRNLMMDIYKPDTPRSDKACVIYVFGGGFYLGARNNAECRKAAKLLNDMGFTAICIDYRLGITDSVISTTKKHQYISVFDTAIYWAVEDCSEAIRYTVEHADEIGIDPQKIVLTGSSAGAITVLQTDFSRCNGMKRAARLPEGWKPAAVVAYAGAIYTRDGRITYPIEPAPTCMFHGTIDRVVRYKSYALGKNHWGGSNYLAKIFKKQRYPHWILRFTDRGHEVAGYLPYTQQEYLGFVNAVLEGRKTYYDATCEDEALKQNEWSKARLSAVFK